VSALHYQLYKTEENAPWIALIHGLFGDADNLSAMRRCLEQHFNIVAIDLPDHGRSNWTENFSFSHYANQIDGLLEDLNIREVNLVGHSLGGKVAMQIALQNPTLVKRLVAIDIAPVKYQSRHAQVFAGLSAVNLVELKNRPAADAILSTYIEDSGTRQFLLKSLEKSTDGWRWRFNLALLQRDYSILSDAISSDHAFAGPTLFIKGELSDYVSVKDKAYILSLFPKVALKVVAQTGHWLHAQKPTVCAKLIESFINQSA
jgi:esterase